MKKIPWITVRSFSSGMFGLLLLFRTSLAAGQLPSERLDDTGGYIHLSPGIVHTTNGCSQFTVTIRATLTNARVFDLCFFFDAPNLALVAVTPGSEASLHLLPYQLENDTLRLDGFFHPNYSAGSVIVAQLTCRAIAPLDTMTQIGFIRGQGFSGSPENPEPIIFSGDTTTIFIDGTPPLPPASVIIIPFHTPPPLNDSVGVFWRPVQFDLHGHPVSEPLYTIHFSDVLNDTSFVLGATTDTFFYHNYITRSFMPGDTGVVNVGLYWIQACKTRP
jgi:hypothetical protein